MSTGGKVSGIGVLLATLVLLAGCSPMMPQGTSGSPSIVSDAPEKTEAGPSEDDLIYERLYEKLRSLEEPNCIGLTNEQMLEDYDALYQTLQENYPYIGVARRKAGADLDALYREGRLRMEQCQTDAGFYEEVVRLTAGLEGVGHLSLLNPHRVLAEQEEYQGAPLDKIPDYDRPWAEDLLQPAALKNMPKWHAMVTPLLKDAIAEVEEEQARLFGETDVLPLQNVETQFLEDGRVAYVAIHSFDMNSYGEDGPILLDFYRQAADCKDLIIDITDNGGGGMGYYYDLIVGPNIAEPLYWKNFFFVKDGANNRKYHPELTEDFYPLTMPPQEVRQKLLEQIPDEILPAMEPFLEEVGVPEQMNREDLQSLDRYGLEVVGIDPTEKEPLFQGRIWVLTSGAVYSSSESFVNFCKATGFATLVGTRTGGDGIGATPLYYVLPISGLVVRYSWIYGATQDGRGSEEFGTEPDVPCQEGETPLEACLRAIREA